MCLGRGSATPGSRGQRATPLIQPVIQTRSSSVSNKLQSNWAACRGFVWFNNALFHDTEVRLQCQQWLKETWYGVWLGTTLCERLWHAFLNRVKQPGPGCSLGALTPKRRAESCCWSNINNGTNFLQSYFVLSNLLRLKPGISPVKLSAEIELLALSEGNIITRFSFLRLIKRRT